MSGGVEPGLGSPNVHTKYRLSHPYQYHLTARGLFGLWKKEKRVYTLPALNRGTFTSEGMESKLCVGNITQDQDMS